MAKVSCFLTRHFFMANLQSPRVVALSAEDDIKISKFFSSYKEAGLRYITFLSDDESYINSFYIYRIINIKKFNFACIKMGIVPKLFDEDMRNDII